MVRAARRSWPAVAALVCGAGFAALGVWQLERRAWKHALIERVEARLAAAPVPAPARAEWSGVDRERAEYRRVSIAGRWIGNATARVQAVTELGPGWWVLTPIEAADRTIVMVNRGFVPQDAPIPRPPDGQPAVVSGLLRLPEPGGGFLRRNRPLEDRWYSRDVAAIAASRRLGEVAPYFIDADAAGTARAGEPVGGLTVVRFRDEHLVYALTWFALAGLGGWGAWRFRTSEAGREHALP